YQILDTPEYPIIYTANDEDDGLPRYYSLSFDSRYAIPRPTGRLPEISREQLAQVSEDPMNLETWKQILPPDNFEFYGFVIINAVDVTSQEVHSALKNDLLQKDAFTSPGSIDRIQARLRTLLRLPQLRVGLIALSDDRFESMANAKRIGRSLLLNHDKMPQCPQRHESVYRDAFDSIEPIIVSDLKQCSYCTGFEHHLINQNVSSLMLAPLRYEKKLIGLLELASPHKDAINAMSAVQLLDVISLFSTAMKRTLDEQEDRVQALMKKRYTSIHPVVEWKFRKSIFDSLASAEGEAGKDTSIVFNDVYPLYGLSDIRDSSINRASAIQSDLIEQLGLALAVVVEASAYRPLPALDEIGFRIGKFVEESEKSPSSDIEFTALEFLRQDVEPLFDMLSSFGDSVRAKVDSYRSTIDAGLGILYNSRKDYEDSVTLINETISSYLDAQQTTAQSMFPHYFEKYKTDGVDYNIYVGQDLVEKHVFDPLYLNNLRLWQLMTTCGIVWQLDKIRPDLPVALETAHLILVQNIPLSIRFREDEKKFDVDGAYNVRYEIVKKRIDKALIRGTEERLTQPGHLAIVYSHSRESSEYRRYLDYLTAAGYFEENTIEEFLLDDLQGANGLRALRVRVAPTPPDMETRMRPERVLEIAANLSPTRAREGVEAS
ncbi:MAG: GAF domain-containing protein, partial [Rhodothermia bacterium]|nr:GAF domain-containing protein [Rhodothermia bacterium]